jgi:uncharacterized protein (TIGR02001 family)
MKKLLLVLAVASTLVSPLVTTTAFAEDAKPYNEVSFNAALTSDYRYRGVSQTRLQPALQGGADYTNNPTGLYLGTWLSTIKWTKDAGGSGDVEWDIYGGTRGEIAGGVSYDFGVLAYVYPSNGLNPDANTTEIYGQFGMGPCLYQILACCHQPVRFCQLEEQRLSRHRCEYRYRRRPAAEPARWSPKRKE